MAPWVNDRRRGLLEFCPHAFTFPNLPDINEPSRYEIFNDKNYAQQATDTLSETILHEPMHYEFLNGLASGLNGRPIVDYRPSGATDPQDGYGPREAMWVKQRGFGDLYNAENYVWFAL